MCDGSRESLSSFLFGSSPYFVCKFLLQIFVKQNQWEQCWNYYKHVPAPYSDPNYFEISRHQWMRESEIKEGRKKKSIFFVWGFNNERLLTLCSFLLCFLLDDGLISCQSKFNLTVVTRPVRRHFNHPKSSRQHFVDLTGTGKVKYCNACLSAHWPRRIFYKLTLLAEHREKWEPTSSREGEILVMLWHPDTHAFKKNCVKTKKKCWGGGESGSRKRKFGSSQVLLKRQ